MPDKTRNANRKKQLKMFKTKEKVEDKTTKKK